MSAPAAKALAEPVSTMQPTPSSALGLAERDRQLAQQLGVQRVQRLGAIEADQDDASGPFRSGFDDQGLVGHADAPWMMRGFYRATRGEGEPCP
jgi:hypothetical protein